MIKVETYSDAVLTIPYGRFCGYDGKGKPDRTGKVSKVIKDGYRSYYDDSLKRVITEDFYNGRLLVKRDYTRKTYTDEHGVVSSLKEKEKTIRDKIVADSIAQKLVFKEAGYKGNTKA